MRVYGNLINRISEMYLGPKPEVGMGVTHYMWSDRHAYTIVEVKNDHMVRIQRDKATLVGEYLDQNYILERDLEGHTFWIRVNKKGQWRRVGHPTGDGYSLGVRSEYEDPSF